MAMLLYYSAEILENENYISFQTLDSVIWSANSLKFQALKYWTNIQYTILKQGQKQPETEKNSVGGKKKAANKDQIFSGRETMTLKKKPKNLN